MAESETTKDVIAGWLGGAVGIVISNPLEVLKVRLQINPHPNLGHDNLSSLPFSRSPSPLHHGHSSPVTLALQYSIPPSCFPIKNSAWTKKNLKSINPSSSSIISGLGALWQKEGYKFLFAGAAAPILGLAFIDAFFFATYGKCMSAFSQDREQPNNVAFVFTSGAIAGGVCALLQTPIEVIKCRAQAEHLNQKTGSKSGSFVIAKKIYQQYGFQGFYLGGLMTGLRDSLSSGVFFTSYALIRGSLRKFCSQEGYQSGSSWASSSHRSTETPVNMIAGGLSGMISALVPYPLDIIKTRLQVSKVASSYQASSDFPHHGSQINIPKSSSSSSIRPIIQQIYAEGKSLTLPHLHQTRIYRLVDFVLPIIDKFKPLQHSTLLNPHSHLLSQRRRSMTICPKIGGLTGFFRGLKPTLLSSFVGSAMTMGIFEFVFEFLGKSNLFG